MKLKTRLIIAFLTIILIPIVLTVAMVTVMSKPQISSFEKTYGLTGTTVESLSNSTQIFSRITEESYRRLEQLVKASPEEMEEATVLEEINEELGKKKAYLIVRKDATVVYIGKTPKR